MNKITKPLFLSRNLSTNFILPLHKKSTQPLHTQKITKPLHKKITQPPKTKTQKSCNLFTHKIPQTINKKYDAPSPPKKKSCHLPTKKITQALHKKIYATSKQNKKTRNIQKKINHATWVSEWVRKMMQPEITQPLHTKNQAISQQKNDATSPQKKWRNLQKNNHVTWVSRWEKSHNLSTHKNHATSPHIKSRNLSTTKNHATSQPKNIVRIAKRCPENITLVVKCLKLLFPKVLRKFIFFYSRECSEKNYATSPHQKSGKLPLLTKHDNFWQNKMLDFCSYLSAHSLYGFYAKPQCRSQDHSYSSCTRTVPNSCVA